MGTSKVFYELLQSPKSPKEIADSLGIKSPPVIEQLRRLQKIGLVRLGEKRGKFQNYEIDSSNLVRLFLEKAPLTLKASIMLKREYTWAGISDNRHLQELVMMYMQKTIDIYKTRKIPHLTILEVMRRFEDALVRSFPDLRSSEDPEIMSLLSLLNSWYSYAKENPTFAQEALEETLKDMGLIDGA
ncbi:MAG: winged helix-turn-helix domain-containing protein [Candidatus Bathyarchaeia archaeon]